MFNTHAAILNDTIVVETPAPSIDLKKCRLANYVVKYEAKRGNTTVGHASRELKKVSKDGDMQLLSNLSASMAFMKFIQKERSLLRQYEETGLYSTEYSKSTKKPFRSETSNTYTIYKTPSEKNIGSFDPLSVYDHLRELVCSGLRSDISLKVQDENEVIEYYFEFRGEQTLEIPMGVLQTILFVRTRKTSTRETSIWFNKNFHFLPVKIEQEKDGDIQAVLVAKFAEAELLEL
jgi:hypothetical protein